jgi:hypothetical protein
MKRSIAIAILLLLLLIGGAATYKLRQPPQPFAQLVPPGPGTAPALQIPGAPPLPIVFGEGSSEPFINRGSSKHIVLEWLCFGKIEERLLDYEEGVLNVMGRSWSRCDPVRGEHALLLLPTGAAALVPLEQPLQVRWWQGRAGDSDLTLWVLSGEHQANDGLEDFSTSLLFVSGVPRRGHGSLHIRGSAGGDEPWTLDSTTGGETIELEVNPAERRTKATVRKGETALSGELRLVLEKPWRLSEPSPELAPTTSASY